VRAHGVILKFKRKYILNFSIALATVSMVLSAIQFNRTKEALLESNQVFFNTIVDASYDIVDTTVNEAIKTYLKGVIDTAHSYVESHKQLPEAQQLADLANTLKVGQSGYLYLLSPDGVHLYHPFLQGQDRSNVEHIQRQLKLEEGVSQYYHANPHETGMRPKVAYSRKLPSGNTLVATTYKDELMFLVDQVQLKEKLSKYAYGESGYIYIVDLDGKRILQNQFDNRAFESVVESTSQSFIRQVLNNREGHVKFDLENESGVATKNIFYKFYPYLNWVIVAGISEQELNKNHSLLFVSLMALFASLIAIISVLVLYLKNRHDKMLELASLDYLTGINSRRSFMEQFKARVQKDQTSVSHLGVVLLDIDHFKRVNDDFGHTQGDKVIQAVAIKLKEYETENRLIARYGGEEFVVVTFDCEQAELMELAETIRLDVENTQGLCRQITISAGCCYAPVNQGVETVIEKADAALYLAKEAGRNNTQCYSSPNWKCLPHIKHCI